MCSVRFERAANANANANANGTANGNANANATPHKQVRTSPTGPGEITADGTGTTLYAAPPESFVPRFGPDSARAHAEATGRRVTYEATMIDGINDTDEDGVAMAELLRGEHAHVNLIPMNQVAHTPWTGSPMPRIERFAAVLRSAGIATTIRRNRGMEIGAACGQLAAEHAGQPAPIVVQRRRERLVAESAAALRGERSHEPVPAGVGER